MFWESRPVWGQADMRSGDGTGRRKLPLIARENFLTIKSVWQRSGSRALTQLKMFKAEMGKLCFIEGSYRGGERGKANYFTAFLLSLILSSQWY